MQKTKFNLTENAFYILKASYSSGISDLAELVEDAEDDGLYDSDIIHRAQQSLQTPMARLEEELTWLPELSNAQIASIKSPIASENVVGLERISEHLPELATANVLAHLICTNGITVEYCLLLLEAWDELDKLNILEALNSNRSQAGFPTIEPKQLDKALQSLIKRHADSAAAEIWALDSPGKIMEKIVEIGLERHPSSLFLERLIRSYDGLSEPDLARIGHQIEEYIARAVNNDGELSLLVGALSNLLIEWDDINQPVQIYEQNQGHEEGRSKIIYEKLRALCLELANERGEYSSAYQLAEALLRTFPELESVAAVLRQDIVQLKALVEQQKQHQCVEHLQAACEAAKTQLPSAKTVLARDGFSHTSKKPILGIFTAFKTALSKLEDKSIAFMVIRDLALYINNDRNEPEIAFRLVDGLLSYAGARPSEGKLVEKLKEERAALYRNWKMNELDKNAGDTKAMLLVVDDLLKFSQGSERLKFGALKAKLVMRRTGEVIKLGIIIVAVTAIAGVIIYNVMYYPSNRGTYQAPTPRATTPRVVTPRVTSPRTATPSSTQIATQESIPPIGQGLTLNRSQVRYCVFQGKRLDSMRSLANTNRQINRFNGLIDDFNSRCANYRYRSGVLSSIEREAASKANALRAEAQRIVASW